MSLVDNILEVDAHVLGCYSSTSVTLHSVIAQELIARGGSSIRLEAVKHGPARVGEVITLPGGKLRSAYVLAAITNPLHAAPTLRSISTSVAAMMQRASSLGAPSLALPLLRLKRHLDPSDILRATLAPIVDHLSGTTSLRRVWIGTQGDGDAAYALGFGSTFSTMWDALLHLGERRAQLAGLREIRARLALIDHSSAFLLAELLTAELELGQQVRALLERELRTEAQGRESLELEREQSVRLLNELERELNARPLHERVIGG